MPDSLGSESCPSAVRGGADPLCDGCGRPHLAQFHVREEIWKRLGISADAFLCPDCVHAIGREHGIDLAWFVNDENYFGDPEWRSLDRFDPASFFAESGLRYCLTHNGVVDCDEDEPCDFHPDGRHGRGMTCERGFDCVLRPLLYEVARDE